jgi:phospholipid transport system substrate-binding protein
MMTRISVQFLLLFFVTIVGSVGLTEQAKAEDPKRVIESVADYAISNIANGGSWSSRRSAARQIVSSRFDVKGAGRFALGSGWKKASKSEQSAYIKAFEATLVERMLDIFEDYSGETIRVVRASKDANNGKYYNVSSVVQMSNGNSIPVDWRLRSRSGRLLAIDVKPKGLSMLQAIRKEYKSVLSRNGGDLQDLVEQMKTLVARSKSKRS